MVDIISSIVDTAKLNPVARVILQGVYDKRSTLSALKGMPHVLQIIWKMIQLYWKRHIQVADKNEEYDCIFPEPLEIRGTLGYFKVMDTKFPNPSDINIYMMPFVMEDTFEKCFLPEKVKPYWNMIRRLLNLIVFFDYFQHGKVGYLTIHENFIDDISVSRTKTGILNNVSVCKKFSCENKLCMSKGAGHSTVVPTPNLSKHGGYKSEYHLKGGIYMALSVSDLCALWNCQVLKSEDGGEVIDKNGNVEHLKELFPKKTLTKRDYIYWLTDRTPHEIMLAENGIYYQCFALITHDLSIWYEDHYTKNPFGVTPNPKITKIASGKAFSNFSFL